MKNQHIIDCYKLDLIRDIPEELELTTNHRNDLFVENQKLKKIIWAVSIGFGCLFSYIIIKKYGQKPKIQEANPLKKGAARKNRKH